MIDLKQMAGLGIKLDEKTNALVFGAGLSKIVPGVRTLENMKRVLLEPECEGPEKVYFMYRGLSEKGGIRFDITVIPAGFLGKEYVKTLGHYHPPAESGLSGLPQMQKARTPKTPAEHQKGVSYPEVYEVLSGQALYLLQKRKDGKNLVLEDIILVRAKPGDKVLIPPDYGHITVNAGRETLVMSNLVYSDFQSVYEPFLEAGGAGYYIVKGKSGGRELEKNKKYQRVPKPREARPLAIPVLGLEEKPLYLVFRQDPRIFEYLKNPGKYGKALFWF